MNNNNKQSLGFPPTIILFDLEYTAWEGSNERDWSGEGEHKETIQNAAVKIRTDTFEEIDFFNQIVRPTINPALSQYIVDLTGITQNMVDTEGVSYTVMIEDFFKWSERLPMYSYGNDGILLEENAKLINVHFPFQPNDFHNLKPIVEEFGISVKDYSSGTLSEAFDVPSPYKLHDALGDARTLALALRLLQKSL